MPYGVLLLKLGEAEADGINVNQRCIGGRVHPGRDFVSLVSQRRIEWLPREVPTVYRNGSRPVAERPADEGKPSGFSLIRFRRSAVRLSQRDDRHWIARALGGGAGGG